MGGRGSSGRTRNKLPELPKLNAKSEKQRAFAEDLRNEYVSENKEYVADLWHAMHTERGKMIQEKKKGIDDPQQIEGMLMNYVQGHGLGKAYVCLTSTDAAEVISHLKKYNNGWNSRWWK